MNKSVFYIAVICFLINPSPGFTQTEYKTARFSVNDELSQLSVNCIYQDVFGFIWFGTNGGLNKYDGYSITEYLNNPENLFSLPNNRINAIYEDPADSGKILWLGSGNGLIKFERVTGKFFQYKIAENKPTPLNINEISCIYKDRKGVYWLGGGGLKRFDKNSGEITSCMEDYDLIYVYSICEDHSGIFWIGSNDGLFKYDPIAEQNGKNSYTHYPLNPDTPDDEYNNLAKKVYEDKDGVLWVGTWNGVYIFDRDFGRFIRPWLKKGDPATYEVNNFIEDKKGNIWYSSAGIARINSCRDSLVMYPNYENNTSYNTSFFYIDRSGIIWVGEVGNGITKRIPLHKKIEHYKNIPGDHNSLGDNDVVSFMEDNQGSMWIGTTWDGLNKFDKNEKRFILAGVSYISLNITKAKNGELWFPSMACLVSYNPGTSINNAYFGDGIVLSEYFNISENNLTNRNLRQKYLDATDPRLIRYRDATNAITYCFIDSEDIIWCLEGVGQTILQYDPVKKEFIPYNIFTDEDVSHSIQLLYEDNSGTLWFGTNGKGLLKRIMNYDADSTRRDVKYIQYKNETGNPASISSNNITIIGEDSSGNMWIGSDGGLNKFNRDEEIFKSYGMKEGLPSDYIAGIVADDEGFIWVSTNKGLSKFDPGSETFRNYDVSDGLQSNFFNTRSCYKSKNGDIYFGGPNGFNVFNPKDIKDNPNIPDVVISGFQLFNEPVVPGEGTLLKESIEYSHEIVLAYDQDVFTLEFTALEFTDPQKNQYAYKMEGVDPDWVYTNSNRRFATYTKLDPGEYIFRVKGSNNDGIWNEAGASISVVVLPPWWRTYWAYSLYFLLIVSTLYAGWRFQLNRLKLIHEAEMEHLQSEKLQEMDRLKSRFFANISHEFRTPLTLITGPAKQIIDETKESEMKDKAGLIYRNAVKLNKLVKQLLDLSKIEAGQMTLRASKLNLISILKSMVLSFTPLAEKKNITLKFNPLEEQLYLYLDRDKVEQIINNILSNAFKFTPENGEILVNVSRNEKTVQIGISDTGIGIPKEKLSKIFDRFYQVDGSHTRKHEGTGIGLALTQELVELHRGNIQVESVDGQGTTFIVSFTMGNKHLRTEEIIEETAIDEKRDNSLIEDTIPEPVRYDEKNNTGLYSGTELTPGNAEKPLVLLVEDSADIRSYIRGFLSEDYRILEAVDGEEGMNKSTNYIPDLIVSDVMMPKMDGFQLCERLKTDERTSHIPIILLTAKAAGEDKIEGLETGADDYIMKPFDAMELKVRIKNLIEQRKKLREHFLKESSFSLDNKNVTSVDRKFLEKSIKIINDHISDSLFGVELFASELALSRVTLYKKLVALIGEPPGELIKRIRLGKAAELIKKKAGNISEIALEVGFNNPAYFSECFKKQFGVNPSQYHQN